MYGLAHNALEPGSTPYGEAMGTSNKQALSFGTAAAQYDQARPSYPEKAIRWALGAEPLRVVDLGAGTGIFSRQLAVAGHAVLPVEPDPGMRRQLVAAAPALEPLDGSAESIPLPDASVDAVTAAQSYHWFDPERAHAEIARVLRPGGVFCPLWNVRDEGVTWVDDLATLMETGAPLATWRQPPSFGEHFHATEIAEFPHSTTHTSESLVALVRSRSFYLVADAERRAEIDVRVRAFAADHPDLAGRTTFELPYVTIAYRARRR